MRNRRDRRDSNKLVLHITNRTAGGLPFIPRRFMRKIIAGIMARCQERHHIRICHFLWMGNHYHMIVAGQGKHISNFMGEMQSAIARVIKKLTPQYQGNVWTGRFKEQRLLTPDDVIDMIVYSYTNPVKAGLVPHADDWSGLSSLEMYKTGSYRLPAKNILSSSFKKIPDRLHRLRDATLLKLLNKLPQTSHELVIQPNAWKKCFAESTNWKDEYILKRVTSEIAAREEKFAIEKKGVFAGMRKIQQQSINKPYISKNKTPTPYLICRIKELRIKAIAGYKAFCDACREAWKKWRHGDISAKFVQGAFRPSMPIVGRLLVPKPI